MNERVYMAGKITGDPDYKKKFAGWAERLQRFGFKAENIVNPAELCSEKWSWLRCMIHDLRLLAGCGVVAMLPDWRESRGARIEHFAAWLLVKETIYLPNL